MGFGPLGVKEAVEMSKNLSKEVPIDEKKGKKDEETNNKEYKTDEGGKKTKKRRHYSHPHGNNVLSYPLGMSPDEANGGRLQITCFEYVPAGAGTFTELTPLKAQKDMTIDADAPEADREIGDGYITSLGSGGSKYVDAGQNLEKGQNVLSGGKNIYKIGKLSNMGASDQINKNEKTLYYVELPIPQDVNDSNTVTWGDDSKNILQLAGLAAGTALVGNEENGRVNLEQLRTNLITASLDASTEISNNKNAIIAAATGKALDAFGAQVTPNSALGISQIKNLKSWITKRNKIAKTYQKAFKNLPLEFQKVKKGITSAYHLFIILVKKNKKNITRDKLHKLLMKKNIMTNLHYIPIHKHPFYRKFKFKRKNFQKAENYYENCLSIPMYASLSSKDQNKVIREIKKIFGFK